MYANQLIFNPIFNKGQLYTGAKPDGDVYQKKAEIHIGYIAGEKREIRAGMTDSVLEVDPYYLFNITDQDNIYMESVAILGVADVSDAKYYAQRYFGETLGANMQAVLIGIYDHRTLKRFLDSEQSAITPRIKTEQVDRFIDVVVKQSVDWSEDYLVSHQGSTRLLLDDMIKNDDHGDLLLPLDRQAFADLIYNEMDNKQLDALFTDVVGLQKLARQLTMEMDKKATDKVKLGTITQSQKPFKRNGMTNLALHMAMSDGQTVAVLFYNPDETPSKLQPKDILVSWKWLLNNRDVTPALQPETGKDVSIATLASRIMQLVDKNHARFVRNVAKQKAQDEKLEELSKVVSDKEATLSDLDRQIADMQAKVDEMLAGKRQNAVDTNPATRAKFEYHPHAKNLDITDETFDQSPMGAEYTVWGVLEGKEQFGVAILADKLNRNKITTKEQAQRVADIMSNSYNAKNVEVREWVDGSQAFAQTKQTFGASALQSNSPDEGDVVSVPSDFDKTKQAVSNNQPIANQVDIDFLNDVIAGKYDVLADDFMAKMEAAATTLYDAHPELVSQAVDYYTAKTDEYATA